MENATTSTQLKNLIADDTQLLIIDEAQQVENIGLKLKLLHDNYPDIQIIATGSSAFELQSETAESLTGRKITYFLYPISYQEIVKSTSPLEAKRQVDKYLMYGTYPEVLNNPGKEKEILIELAQSYLYKDLLQLDNIRKPSHLEKLLQALAFQVGNEVNYHELSQAVGNINTATVEKYLDFYGKSVCDL